MTEKNVKKDTPIKAIAATAAIMIASLLTAPACAERDTRGSNRLIMFQGFILSAYFDDQYREVKRLASGGAFYGYGWLDDHRVFVAYQPETHAAAIAELEIIDLRQSRTTKLDTVGAGGESNFDVNPSTGEIVFNTDNAVKVMRVDAKTNSYRLENITDVFCWNVFWIDNKTIGCKPVGKDKRFVKYPVPNPSKKPIGPDSKNR